jgi:hypothetical protein
VKEVDGDEFPPLQGEGDHIWGWCFFTSDKQPIPLPTSPLKGEEKIRIPGLKKILYEREGTNTIMFSRLGRRMI